MRNYSVKVIRPKVMQMITMDDRGRGITALSAYLFGQGLEYFFRLTNAQTCSLSSDADLFEERSYTIDGFAEYLTPYIDAPEEFFACFRDVQSVSVREGRHPRAKCRRTTDYDEMLLDSPVQTRWPENNLVPFKWFRSSSATTALLFAPGWGRRGQSVEEDMCRRLRQHGVDVALLTVPFHQARTPAKSFNGEYFISANLFLTIQNFRQFVAEIRLVTQFLRTRYEQLGIIGMSSGGFQAGLAAICEPFDYLFPVITGCHLASIAWHGWNTQFLRRDLEHRGITEQGFARAWQIIDLAVVGHHCQAKIIKNYIALHDRVIPTRYQFDLWRVYGQPAHMLLPASHYSSYFYRHEVVDDIARVVLE